MLSGQQKKLPSTSDILFSSINFIILSNNMTMRILSEVTFPSEKKKKTKFLEFEKAFRLLTGEPSFK